MEEQQEPVKILFTIPNFDTAGSGKALLKIAERLDRDLFEPHIACFHEKGAFFRVVKESGIPVHIFRFTTPMVPRLKGFAGAWKISRFLKKNNFDLIHSFHYAADYSEPLAAWMAGVKWIFTKKNMNWGGVSGNAWKIRSFLASGIIAQNTDMIRNFYPGNNKVKLIPRGVDTSEFYPAEPSPQLKREFNIKEDDFVILMVANLVPVKGAEVLINAFESLALPNARLFIVGDDNSDYARELKKRSGLNSDKITFTGKRPDIKDFHSIASLFILPTLNQGRQEGSPVSLLEAMASGEPVLASDVAGIRDQLRNLPGQLFTPGDAVELAEKIKTIYDLPRKEREAISEKQLEIIRSGFTIQHEVEAHSNFYMQVMKKGKKAGAL